MSKYVIKQPMPKLGEDIYKIVRIPDDIADKIKEDGIKEFAEWLPKHFDLRFSNNPDVWVDEYFNHTSEKILEQLKEEKNDSSYSI